MNFFKLHRFTIILSISCFFCGLALLLVRRHWVIFRLVPAYAMQKNALKATRRKKQQMLYYWHEGERCETVDCIWGSIFADNIKTLVGRWLALMYEERIIAKRIQLESVALCQAGQSVFLSFDRPLLEPTWSIYKKWNLIKSLLKTIKTAEPEIQDVMFLVRHEVMHDPHLEFSQPIV